MRGRRFALISWLTVMSQLAAQCTTVGELERELELCRRENNDLRRQVRRYHDEVDDMRRREYDERHDHYECHDSYDRHKQRRTSTEVTLSSSGGYVWPHAETPQIVVSPP
jgi:chromosome segregation ATPase